MSLQKYLSVTDHNRDVSGMKYVYPVVSRRAGGVSIGINLNTNNACNWRCIYCSVPNLTRGNPPPIEMTLLADELRTLLNNIVHGDFMQRHVAETDRHLMDIAFSGNGEPTSAKEFPQVILLVEKILAEFDLLGKIKIRLISNGSLIDKPSVLEGLKDLAKCNGEVWFKVDAGSKEAIAKINDVNLNPQSHIERLKKCAQICPTFIQTCMFGLDDQAPSEADILDYLALISEVKSCVQGVHLYGLARESHQAEASRLTQLPADWLEKTGQRIRTLGITVYVSP